MGAIFPLHGTAAFERNVAASRVVGARVAVPKRSFAPCTSPVSWRHGFVARVTPNGKTGTFSWVVFDDNPDQEVEHPDFMVFPADAPEVGRR